MAIEENSFRIGVAVTLIARLYSPDVEADPRFRPATGPADQETGDPVLRTEGTPGTESYRRIWEVTPPRKGASPFVKLGGDASALSGFEGTGKVTTGGTLTLLGLDGKLITMGLPPSPSLDAPETLPVDALVPVGPSILGDPDDVHVAQATVLARSVRLRLNPHRIADEAEVEIPIEALPFIPDGSLLRSIMVEIRRGVIDPDDWATAMETGKTALDGRPLTLPVLTESDEPDLVGFVDVHAIRFASSGPTTVKLTIRDLSGVLADSACRSRSINNDLPADEAVARFCSLFPAAVGLTVVWVGASTPPILGEFAPKSAKSKSGKTTQRAQKAAQQGNALEAIADFCTLAAVIPTFRGYRLELAPARTLDQFSASEVRRMVVGQNIEDLELEHRMAGQKTRAVVVRSFNPDTGRVVQGCYPDDPARTGPQEPGALDKSVPSGPLVIPPGASGIDEAAPTVMNVYGITNPQQLREIAQNVWEEQARQDLQGRLITKDLATVEGRGLGIPDLLALRAGDPIGIWILPTIEAGAGSFIQRLAGLPVDQAVDVMVQAGWRREVAQKVAPTIISNRKPSVYRVRGVDFQHQLDQATTTEISMVNYIEVVDAELRGTRPPGGNRAALMKATAGAASYEQLHDAVEADYLAGEISASEAARLQKDLAEQHAVTMKPENFTPKPAGYTPKTIPASKVPPGLGFSLGGAF